ncbi:hypothetical protein ET475_07240 [Microbacterium protaetiae]|uniref:YbaB/EbfC family DNA-binding protein n=1 Tax=Microbacterium protaetiae TaxID=2509458 RepID=A0A4P6ECL8_9MICO|nr:YbaB/EbfC family nucleoid-associated protein [Microbacterium protaetiae]QAY59804.1 hypothetical protein ET475_07240 [Microbacterium protaetiae]
MFTDADEAIARVEDDVRRAQGRAQRMSRLQEAAAAARGVGRGREVVVQVDQTGELVDLRIADAALSRGGAGVARLVLESMRMARTDLRRNLLAAASEILGDDDPVLGGLRAQLEADATAR